MDVKIQLLPETASDVLKVPVELVPRSVRLLSKEKRLSALMRRLNDDRRSDNPEARDQAAAALRHLGFPD